MDQEADCHGLTRAGSAGRLILAETIIRSNTLPMGISCADQLCPAYSVWVLTSGTQDRSSLPVHLPLSFQAETISALPTPRSKNRLFSAGFCLGSSGFARLRILRTCNSCNLAALVFGAAPGTGAVAVLDDSLAAGCSEGGNRGGDAGLTFVVSRAGGGLGMILPA